MSLRAASIVLLLIAATAQAGIVLTIGSGSCPAAGIKLADVRCDFHSAIVLVKFHFCCSVCAVASRCWFDPDWLSLADALCPVEHCLLASDLRAGQFCNRRYQCVLNF
jgi:hypothetical protein